MNQHDAVAAGAGAFGLVFLLFVFAFVILMIASVWKVFTKAGQPGWAAIVPILNVYILIKVADKPGWWLLLYFIPIVNIVVGIIVIAAVARNFGKDVLFVLGMIFLPFICYPILGFGSAQYRPA